LLFSSLLGGDNGQPTASTGTPVSVSGHLSIKSKKGTPLP